MSTAREDGEAVKTILLVGATGNLGGFIARALLTKGARLRLLVRPGSRAKLATDVAAASEVVENEAGAFDGVYTVVSAIQGGPETIVDAQLNLLRAARAAGVRRFIPSDYSFNFFGLAEGENPNSDWRREFARRAEQERGAVEVVHVLNGCFLDAGVLFGFLGAFDLEKGEAYLWGDGNEKMEFTTYADTAAYTAEAAVADGPLPDRFFVAGESLTFHELVNQTAAGLGRPVTVKKLGRSGCGDRPPPSGRTRQHVFLAAIDVLARRAERQGKARSTYERTIPGDSSHRRARVREDHGCRSDTDALMYRSLWKQHDVFRDLDGTFVGVG
ncbi:MAG: NmrA family NAD(P)-binding protein [Gammaproteobacteria bacterium]